MIASTTVSLAAARLLLAVFVLNVVLDIFGFAM